MTRNATEHARGATREPYKLLTGISSKAQFESFTSDFLKKAVSYYSTHNDVPDWFKNEVLAVKKLVPMRPKDFSEILVDDFKNNTTVNHLAVYFNFMVGLTSDSAFLSEFFISLSEHYFDVNGYTRSTVDQLFLQVRDIQAIANKVFVEPPKNAPAYIILQFKQALYAVSKSLESVFDLYAVGFNLKSIDDVPINLWFEINDMPKYMKVDW